MWIGALAVIQVSVDAAWAAKKPSQPGACLPGRPGERKIQKSRGERKKAAKAEQKEPKKAKQKEKSPKKPSPAGEPKPEKPLSRPEGFAPALMCSIAGRKLNACCCDLSMFDAHLGGGTETRMGRWSLGSARRRSIIKRSLPERYRILTRILSIVLSNTASITTEQKTSLR
jgi:hypothetical protein